MTSEVTKLTLAVDSSQVGKATGELDRFAQAGKKSEQSALSFAKAGQAVGRVMGVIAAAAASREVIEIADTYKNLAARLSLVETSATGFARAQKALIDISQQTRVGLQQTTELYGTLSRATETLGVSQKDVLSVTESINKALIISGGNASSANAALIQLGQGLASGTLRGEELNSVLEQAPRLAKAIADGLGVPIGKLRQLGQEGKLTSQEVFGALQKASDALSAEFEKLPLTVGQSLTQISNSVLLLVGAVDQATGSTNELAVILSDAAKYLRELSDEIQRAAAGAEDVGLIAKAFLVVKQTIQVLYANIKYILKVFGLEIAAIAAQIVALSELNISGFNAISRAVKEDTARARAELDEFEKRVLGASKIQYAFPDVAGGGRGVMQDPRIIGRTPASETAGYRAPTADSVKKKVGKSDTATATDEAKAYASAIEAINKAQMSALMSSQQLTPVQQQLVDIFTNPAFAAMPEKWRQIIAAQGEAALAAEAQATAERNNAKAMEEAQEKGKRFYEETRTASELLNDALREQDELLAILGPAYQTTYDRAVLAIYKANEESNKLSKEMDDFAKKAAENIQDSLGDGLYDIMQGNFSNIGDSFKRMLDRMVAEALAANLAKAMFGDMVGGSGSGWFGEALGAIGSALGLSGARAIGGSVSKGGMYRVNERGPELLSVGGKEYLMMGNQSGKVKPGAGNMNGGSTNNYNITVSMPQGANRATALQFGRDISRQLAMANSRNG